MQFQRDIGDHAIQIQSYQTGCVVLNHESISVPIAISKEERFKISLPSSFDKLSPEHFEFILQQRPEIILVGTGLKTEFLSLEIEAYCASFQKSIDIMSSAAACRTFTVLAAENRDVIAMIFP